MYEYVCICKNEQKLVKNSAESLKNYKWNDK